MGLACYVTVSVGEADEHLLVCEFLGILERGVAHPGLGSAHTGEVRVFSFEAAKRDDFLIYERYLDRGQYHDGGSEPPWDAGPRVRVVTVEQRGVRTKVIENPSLTEEIAFSQEHT